MVRSIKNFYGWLIVDKGGFVILKEILTLILGILLTLFGAFGSLSGPIFSYSNFQGEKIEFPLSMPKSIVVDSHGHIYCGLNFYSRIQVYNRNGKFLKGWPVNALGGDFRIFIDNKDRLQVITNSGRYRYIYNFDGKMLKSDPVNIDGYTFFNEDPIRYRCKDKEGNLFEIKQALFPGIYKTSLTGEKVAVISMPISMWFFTFPVSLLIFGIGMSLNVYILFFKKS